MRLRFLMKIDWRSSINQRMPFVRAELPVPPRRREGNHITAEMSLSTEEIDVDKMTSVKKEMTKAKYNNPERKRDVFLSMVQFFKAPQTQCECVRQNVALGYPLDIILSQRAPSCIHIYIYIYFKWPSLKIDQIIVTCDGYFCIFCIKIKGLSLFPAKHAYPSTSIQTYHPKTLGQ